MLSVFKPEDGTGLLRLATRLAKCHFFIYNLAIMKRIILPKTVVIGADGFIGRALHTAMNAQHPGSLGTSRRPQHLDRAFLDLTAPDIGPLRLRQSGHQRALILAAEPNIARCQNNPEASRALNVTGTLALVDQLLSEGIRPVFFSSDYVFDGFTGNYREDQACVPSTLYGQQKLEVERAITEKSAGKALILRLSKIYSLHKGDGILLDEMAALFAAGQVVRAAGDQVFNPMYLDDLVAVVCFLLETDTKGVLHVCGDEAQSRYHMASALVQAMGADPALLQRISLDDLGLNPIRPKRTSMSNARLRALYHKPMTRITTYVKQTALNYESV